MSEENQESAAVEVAEQKSKKISKMTLAEVETAYKKSTESMNGENSKYIQHLKARKEELSK